MAMIPPVGPTAPTRPHPFERLGLRRIINAAGKMTYLGGSALSPDVAWAMAQAGGTHVDMAELQRAAGRYIARLVGAEDALVTSCAASGLVAAVAACLTGTDVARVRRLPDTQGLERTEVVLQKGHAVDFGMEITQLIRMTGATPVEVGSVNLTRPDQMAAALGPRTAAVVHVISHHARQEGMLDLRTVVEMAREKGIPVVVDAAAELDLRAHLAAGATLVVFSGQKAVGAPTSGFVAGKGSLVEACRLQELGICRPMKVGKESIAGLLQALEEYTSADEAALREVLERRARHLAQALSRALAEAGCGYARVDVVSDETRPIPRVSLQLDPGRTPVSALSLVHRLEAGDPSVRTRNHHVDSGIVLFDVRALEEADVQVVVGRVVEALAAPG